MLTKLLNKGISIMAVLLVMSVAASAKVRIVASLPDLGSIAAYIGGDKVSVSSITNANANPHSVEVFPSYMAKVSQAALYLKCGLELDQWADAIIDGSRNNNLAVVDCSNGIEVLEKPTGKVDASKGDVHPFGNPHYWLNPANGIIIARNILAGLQKVDPDNAQVYQTNAASESSVSTPRCCGSSVGCFRLLPLLDKDRGRRSGSRSQPCNAPGSGIRMPSFSSFGSCC